MLSVRITVQSDIELYFNWANDKVVRDNSFHNEEINWETHLRWFKGKLNDENSYLYVAEDNGNPIGQIRFDLNNNVAELGYSLGRNFRGLGLGKKILQLAIAQFSRDYSKTALIRAQVKEKNISSIKIFTQLGFVIDRQHQLDEVVSYQFQPSR